MSFTIKSQIIIIENKKYLCWKIDNKIRIILWQKYERINCKYSKYYLNNILSNVIIQMNQNNHIIKLFSDEFIIYINLFK